MNEAMEEAEAMEWLTVNHLAGDTKEDEQSVSDRRMRLEILFKFMREDIENRYAEI